MAEVIRQIDLATEAGVFMPGCEFLDPERAEASGYVAECINRGIHSAAGQLLVRLDSGQQVAVPYAIVVPES